MKKNKKSLFVLMVGFIMFVPIFSVQAFELIPPCAKSGDGGICCALKVGMNISHLILGFSGSIALLFFVWAGFTWIMSAGQPEKIKKGLDMMKHTIIGMFVIIIAWFAVNLVITSLAGSPQIIVGNNITDPKKNWYDLCKGYNQCEIKHGKDGWKCQHFSMCGLKTYKECDNNSSFCERWLCPGNNENVCCKAVTK